MDQGKNDPYYLPPWRMGIKEDSIILSFLLTFGFSFSIGSEVLFEKSFGMIRHFATKQKMIRD
jgi:hypothetical protein